MYKHTAENCAQIRVRSGEKRRRKEVKVLDSEQVNREMANENTQREMDRIEAAPLTSERRYGIFRTGLIAAFILIVVLVGAAIALLFGIRDATILLSILLPLMLLTAMIAHLWFWWLHRRASRRREHAANEWVSATLSRQTNTTGSAQNPESNNSFDVWFKRAPHRTSGYTPPPGYHIVEEN